MKALPVISGLVLQMCAFGVLPASAQQVSVHVVADRPGATLYAGDSPTALGKLPLNLRATAPTPWTGCTSLGEYRAQWPDGVQLTIGRIEICPDGGASQEVRIALPAGASIPPVPAPTMRPVICHSAGLAYKPASSLGCGRTTREHPAFAAASPQFAAPRTPSGGQARVAANEGGQQRRGSGWQTFGQAVGAFVQGWAQGAALASAYSVPLPVFPDYDLVPSLPTSRAPQEPTSGSSYDWRSGNRYTWRRDWDGSTSVRGSNWRTGAIWRTTIEQDGSMRGTDSDFNTWRYNARTKTYMNFGTGQYCFGEGAFRTCTK